MSTKEKENYCILSDNTVLIIDSFETNNGNVNIKGKHISELNSFFFEPCDSKTLNMYCTKNISSSLETISVQPDFVKSKCICIPCATNNDFVIIPLLQYNN